MAIEKMELVKVSGSLENMPEVCEKLCECECFHPEQANKHISAEMGFMPFTDENPYAAQLSEVTELASGMGITPELVELKRMAEVSDKDKE